MDASSAVRRQVENEMIFRSANETISRGLDDLNESHISDGNPQLARDDNMTLYFICECSDENCSERIPIKLRTYQALHENRDVFVIRANHQVEAIEKVIAREAEYSVVEKSNTVATPSGGLNKTDVDNVS